MRRIFYILFIVAALLLVLMSIKAWGGGEQRGLWYRATPAEYNTDLKEGELTTKTYTLGIIDADGNCTTINISADSEREAFAYARENCPGCKVENLTDRVYYGAAEWNLIPRSELYCIIRK